MDRPVIKGFKHLRPGEEVAVEVREMFGRGVSYYIRTIREVDFIEGVICLTGTAREFGLDGAELGHTGGEPRHCLIVPIPDEVRRVIWRDKANDRIRTLLHNWKKLDDNLIQAVIEAIDQWDDKPIGSAIGSER